MKALRKGIGLLLLLISIPVLIATIWSVGAARVVIKPKFFAEVPQQVIKVMPDIVDKAFAAAKQPGAIQDANAKAWIDAAAKVSITPHEMLKNMGMYQWLQGELSASLDKLGAVLRGDSKAQDVILDNRPLKKALLSPVFQKYIQDVLQHLPTCTQTQIGIWGEKVVTPNHEYDTKKLPACNPGPTATQIILGKIKLVAESQIKDQHTLLRGQDLPTAFVGIRLAGVGLWFLFLFPLLLLLVAASIGGIHRRSKLRLLGIATFFGGIVPLSISWFIKDIGLRLMMMDPWQWNLSQYSSFWTSQANQVLVEKLSMVGNQALAPLFSSVFTVASAVTLLGVLFFILSWAASNKEP